MMRHNGYQLWLKNINNKGGINGKEVHLIIRDDQGSEHEALRIYRDFIKDNQVDFVFGPT